MKLNHDALKILCGAAVQAARKAGAYIAATRPEQVVHKEGGDSLASQVLTEVDGACERMILDMLEPTFAQYDLGLLTEETPDDGGRLIRDYFWCIDPIDGTLPYVEGIPGYAVSIALVSRTGDPVIGAVYDPVEQTDYHAFRGGGAFRNGEPWRPALKGPDLHIFSDRTILEEPWFDALQEALADAFPKAEIKAEGGAVMNALWCLENAPATYFKFPKPQQGGGCFWDFAATACIYRELGATATDIEGAPLPLNDPDSIYMNRRGILFATDNELAARITAFYRDFGDRARS